MLLISARLFLVTFSFILGLNGFAQQPAFPGAEGAGGFVSGGRGTLAVATTVYEVTNLNDDNLPGSFRYAVTNNAPAAPYRTIVFRVSGTIHLNSALAINRANTTIAGQTAPGGGICLADYPVSISNDNVIVRYIRFRMGDKNQNKGMVDGSGSDDSFGALGRKNLMIDHCTMSWSSDEACTIYRGDSTTLQWNILSEPLNYSYHFETGDTDWERHGYGGIWGGRHASFHHNLLAHCTGRMPRFDGSRNLGAVVGAENADFRNNVLYDWGSYNVNGGEGGNYNIVNNYYKWGPSTSTGLAGGVRIRYQVLNPYKQASPLLPYGKYYMTGNYVDSLPGIPSFVTYNNWRGAVMNGGTAADTSSAQAFTPFALADIATQSAAEAYELVLQNAGAILPKRDTLDERIVNDVRNRTGAIIDVQGGYPHGTPYLQTVNAWPKLDSTAAPVDTDHDGMPDTWELTNGLNPNNAADRNVYTPNGYTQLENYLNGITAALPLKLLSFNAVLTSKTVSATWTTSNEINVKGFIVERSTDSRTFSAVGSADARNTFQNSYIFTDDLPLNDISYYRLKMIDKDGVFSYSRIVKVNNAGKNLLIVAPNPAVNSVVVSHTPALSTAVIKVSAADGKMVTSVNVKKGAVQTPINTSTYKSGVYYLIFENEGQKSTTQFIKE